MATQRKPGWVHRSTVRCLPCQPEPAEPAEQLDFERGDDGVVAGLVLHQVGAHYATPLDRRVLGAAVLDAILRLVRGEALRPGGFQMATRQKLENTVYEPKEWETVTCLVCGSDEKSVYEKFGDRRQYTYVTCRACGLIYQSPRPRYDESFVYDAYEFYADGDVKFDESGENFMGQTRQDYEREIAELLEFDGIRSAVLDVGCATGDFLSVAREHYRAVQGLDVSTRMANVLRKRLGIDIFTCHFDELATDQRFSCIRMSHVIEHIPNPHGWLQKAKALLASGGIVDRKSVV